MSNELIREELRSYLKQNGIMQIYICEELNINRTTLNQFILNKRNISYKKLKKIYDYLYSKGVNFCV